MILRDMNILIPPVLFVICLLLMGLVRLFWPIKVIMGYPFSLMGLMPLLMGLMLGGTGAFKFFRERTNIHPFHEADKLVTSGVFRYTRNPMYLGLSLVLGGVWILLGAISPIMGVIIFVVVSNCWYIPYEERMLSEKFGETYEDYRRKVRRWF
jgi:protein-S-isoprenylcysteine O-methyltransferase Ste14